MTEILELGIDIIQWLEGFRSPLLNQFFFAVTDIGSTAGYLVMLPILWWAFSWKLGARLFVGLVLSVYINTLIKDLVALPRPFVYADIANLRAPGEFSFPSGHAQQAVVFWGLLALHFKKRWFAVVATLSIFLIGFSRVYLGAHFPSDVLAGWTLGAAIAWGYARWSNTLAEKTAGLSLSAQVLLALGAPIALALVHPSRNTALAMGGLAGALGGLVFAYHEGLYPEGGQARSRRAWLVIGLLGLPVIYFVLQKLSPAEDASYYYLYLWLRFAAIGLWVSFLVPRIVAVIRDRRAHA